MSRKVIAYAMMIFILILHSRGAQAELEISELSLSETTLTFRLSGTIGENVINESAVDQNILFIGEPGNTAWYNGPGVPNNYLAASWVPESGTTGLIAPAVNQDDTYGDYVLMVKSGGNFVATDEIDGVFTATSNNLFDPDIVDLSSWIVSIGSINAPHPDLDTKVGSVVPEPASIAIMSLGALCLVRRRRDRPEVIAADV